ncbi:MAG: N-acetyltransferase [Chloroflexi bacterium]|nr:N-acetyltransferase [Chloroflexota bacterium]
MTNANAPNLTIRMAHSINEIDREIWDRLSAGRPFQSHRWYQFGERVMSDCQPIYVLAYKDDDLIGRAALWTIRNEPLPIGPGIWRALFQAILRRWPLLICRSPLSSATGLILPSGQLHDQVLTALSQAALTESAQRRCLMLLFDFLGEKESQNWSNEFQQVKVPNPGAVMQNRWASLEEYLTNRNKKDRQHYKRTLREAEKLNISLERFRTVPDVDAALELIRNIDRRHGNPTNPWMRNLLENMEIIEGTWLDVRQEGRLVGGGAIFEDNDAQMTTALGLAENSPYVYLLLTYASLEEAFKKKVRLLRWGSGAYEVKQQLGFEMESNEYIVIASGNPFVRKISQWLAG